MTEWQPIETAPKGELPIWVGHSGSIYVAIWRNDRWTDYFMLMHTRTGDRPGDEPTHWMPLPEPPKQEAWWCGDCGTPVAGKEADCPKCGPLTGRRSLNCPF